MTTHEILVAGYERLATGRWLQGRLWDQRGGYCARGTMIASMQEGRIEAAGEELLKADKALWDCLPKEWQMENDKWGYRLDVVAFNNASDTTKEDVLALFRRAIVLTAPKPDPTFEAAEEIDKELMPV